MNNPWIDIDDLDDPTSKFAEYAIDSASFLLWSLSGRKYTGVKEITEHYVCPQYDIPVDCTWIDDTTFEDRSQGIIRHVLSVLGSDQSGVKIPLRHGPVRDIDYVEVGGKRLKSSTYYIESNKYLIITGAVPACSGITVCYKFGVLPPSMGKLSAIILANNIVDDLEGRECALPQNVSSVSRQGISFEVYDPQEFLDKGRVGIFTVDAFLHAVNPANAKKKTKIFAAGMPKGKTRRKTI